jgi:hypothetical protein
MAKGRHYGLKIGDEVEYPQFRNLKVVGVVQELSSTDNNRCYIKLKDGRVIPAVCEWCKKKEKR